MGIVDFEEVLDEDIWMCVEVSAVVMVDCKVEITGNKGITIQMLGGCFPNMYSALLYTLAGA